MSKDGISLLDDVADGMQSHGMSDVRVSVTGLGVTEIRGPHDLVVRITGGRDVRLHVNLQDAILNSLQDYR